MLDQLNDKQNILLNEISYKNIDFEGPNAKPPLTLFKAISPSNPDLAIKLKNAGLGDLVVKDYVNKNDGSGSGFCAIAFVDPKTGETGMAFRGTEGMDDLKHNPKDMVDNILTGAAGVSSQSLEALAFFEKNESENGDNYLYGHSKGGELAAEAFVANYTNIKGIHIINAQPINPYKLTPDQWKALRSDKVDAMVVNGDFVSWIGTNIYPVRYLHNNGKKPGFFGPHDAWINIDYDSRGNAVSERKPFFGYFKQGVASLAATSLIGAGQLSLGVFSFAVNFVVRIGNFIVNDLPELAKKFIDSVMVE